MGYLPDRAQSLSLSIVMAALLAFGLLSERLELYWRLVQLLQAPVLLGKREKVRYYKTSQVMQPLFICACVPL